MNYKIQLILYCLLGSILCFVGNDVYAQTNQTVTGRVVDQSSNPLEGVTVVVKGTTASTVTGESGNFSLSVPAKAVTLVFSSVGYRTIEVTYQGQKSLTVSLEADNTSLDEVVVVGYGTQRRGDLTGSIASADIEAFRESPNINILQSLQGSVPGVQIGQVNQAGQEPNLSVRGRTTLSGSTGPLIVLDGVIYRGRIGDLNPKDIKSVDILKDASSKAIYGAQAANGVMLITTFFGHADQTPQISYTGTYASQAPTVNARLLNREEVLEKIRLVDYQNAFLAPDYTEHNPNWDYSDSELNPRLYQGVLDGTNFDWWDALTNIGHIADHQISFTGGAATSNYFLSTGYTDQKGLMLNDKYKRITARMNIETDLKHWLTLGVNSFGSFTDFSGSSPNMETVARGTSPLTPSRDENGTYYINPLGNYSLNPFLTAEGDDRDRGNQLFANLYINVDVPWIEGLSYRINYSNALDWSSHAYSNAYDRGLVGLAFKRHTSSRDVLFDNIIGYNRKIGSHFLDLTFVAGYNKVDYDRTYAEGDNIPDLSLSYNSLQQATRMVVNSGAWDQTALYQMGRINYNYLEKYLLTATVRRDGFSGFSRNHKFGIFPSFGAGWVISNEDFFNVGGLDLLKLRASYGVNGNLTARYSSISMVTASQESSYVFGDGASTSLGHYISSLANDDLTWEKTKGLNLGLDLNLFNGRINGSVEYYATSTTDLLWDVTLPRLIGFSEIRTNIGNVRNNGLEIDVSVVPVQNRDFRWNLGLNFSANRNKVSSLLGIDSDGDGVEDDLIGSSLFIGHSIGTIYNYEIDGIWQLDDDIPSGFFPGTYRIVDQNNDGNITAADDRSILGRTEPAYRFGIQSAINYKNFMFRFFIHGVQGGRNGYLGANHPTGVETSIGTAQNSNWFTFYDYWSPSNPNATFPITWQVAQIRPSKYMSRSFIRVQDISLSYTLNEPWTKKIGLNNMKIYVSGKNLFTFTNWDGWDPETGQGVGIYNALPVMKSYAIGLDFAF